MDLGVDIADEKGGVVRKDSAFKRMIKTSDAVDSDEEFNEALTKLETIVHVEEGSNIKQEINPICWGCLVEDDLKDMHQTYYYNGKPEVYSELMSYCFSIQVDDGDNSDIHYHICETCVIRLREAANFRTQIEVTRNTFKNVLANQKPMVYPNLTIDGGDDDTGADMEEEWLEDVDVKPLLISKVSPTVGKSRRRPAVGQAKPKVRARPRARGGKASSVRPKEVKEEELEEGEVTVARQPRKAKTKTKELMLEVLKDENDDEEMSSMDKGDKEFKNHKRKPPQRRAVQTEKPKRPKRTKEELPYKLEKTDLQCKICGETFPVHKGLQMHMPIHFPNHICEQCGRWFATRTQLKVHVNSHTTEREACPICPNRVFKATGGLKAHMRTHAGDKFHYKCKPCKLSFRNNCDRHYHLVAVHGEEDRKYKCRHCPMRFRYQSGLSVHTRRMHLKERNKICKLCDSVFFSNMELQNHMRRHTGERSIECEFCHKRFGRKYTLREHLKIHLGIKEHVCPVCNRRFTQKCSLKSHISVHDKEANLYDSEKDEVEIFLME